MRESGIVYSCPSGKHDDLGISCAMLTWAARHPHLDYWASTALAARRPRRPRDTFGWGSVCLGASSGSTRLAEPTKGQPRVHVREAFAYFRIDQITSDVLPFSPQSGIAKRLPHDAARMSESGRATC